MRRSRTRLRIASAAIVLSLLWCVGVLAQPPLTITTSGYYITQLDSAGVPSLVQITTVIDMTGGTDSPQPPDKSDVDAEIVKQVRAWSDEVADPQSAQAVAAVYSHVKGAVDDGTLNSTTVWLVLKDATDSAISVAGGGNKWSEFRKQLSAVVTEGQQRGTLQSPPAISRLMRSVQHGLELSADGSDALSLDDLVVIAAKTNEAIDEHK